MNNEIILDIKEFYRGSYGGYEITTNKQTIQFLMELGQQCCEQYDFFLSEDDTQNFIGTEVKDIYLTDTALKTVELEEDIEKYADIIFVNIETDKDTLQFVAYNYHNGYYGHDVIIKSNQLNHEEVI